MFMANSSGGRASPISEWGKSAAVAECQMVQGLADGWGPKLVNPPIQSSFRSPKSKHQKLLIGTIANLSVQIQILNTKRFPVLHTGLLASALKKHFSNQLADVFIFREETKATNWVATLADQLMLLEFKCLSETENILRRSIRFQQQSNLWLLQYFWLF